jgi:hypothetical protein
MAGDEMAIMGRDEIGLNEIGTELYGQRIALKRVSRQVAVRATVPDHERPALVTVLALIGIG